MRHSVVTSARCTGICATVPCIFCREMCDCAIHNQTTNDMMRPIQLQYWERLHELINVNATYDNDDGFTVVLQPHFRDQDAPRTVRTTTMTASPSCCSPTSGIRTHPERYVRQR